MSHRGASSLLLLGLCACADRRPTEPSRLDEARALVRSSNTLDRARGARTIERLCCPDSTEGARTAEGPDACRALATLFDTEADWVVLDGVTRWGPACYEEIPASALIATLRRPGGGATRVQIVDRLGELDPSPELVAALIAELAHAKGDSAHDVQLAAALGLAALGEADLEPVVDALTSPDPELRRGAARTWVYATDVPLRMPSALTALERAAKDADQALAGQARQAASHYRRTSDEPADEAVARLLATVPPHATADELADTLNQLALRWTFCTSNAVTAALAQYAANPDTDVAAAARRALSRRVRRCKSR